MQFGLCCKKISTHTFLHVGKTWKIGNLFQIPTEMPGSDDIISGNEQQFFPHHYLLNQFEPTAAFCHEVHWQILRLGRSWPDNTPSHSMLNNLNSKPTTPVFSSLDVTVIENLRYFKKKKMSLSYFIPCIWILIRMVFLGQFSVCLVERGRKLFKISINQFFSEKLKSCPQEERKS